MTKKIQTIFLVSFLSLVLMLAIFIPTIFTKDFASASIYDSNLTYDSVEKIIDVSNDKVLDVTEKITVSYKNDINVGLSRNISKINKITRIWQGKEYVVTTINKFDLKSVKVSHDGLNFEDEYNFITQDEDYYYINIGADGDFKVGTYTYEIKYLYDMGEDFINDFDDFTFDLMDYGFASPVKHFSATVNFPKLFLKDGEKIEDYLSFRQGLYDNISLTDASFSYIENDDNTFSFSCELNDLFATEGLTVQLILPENYFDTSYTPNAWYWVAFSSIFVAVLSVVLVVIVNRKWKTKNVVITPEFYPPKDYSPLDVARTYRGRLKSEDFASLVIYWAGKGYVNLKNNENKIVLTKLKNLPDTDSKSPLFHSKEAEKRYFNAIFEKQEEVVFSENSIASSNIQTAVKELYSVEQEKQNKLLIPRIVIQALSFLPVLFLFLWSFLLGFSSPTSLFIAVFPLIAVFVAINVDLPILMKVFWCLLFGGAPLYMLMQIFYCVYDLLYLSYIIPIIFVGLSFMGLLLKTYTEQDLKDLGKILGFKNFLITAELSRLEMLVEENPNYYYDILPFCYVFNITDKIEEKFKNLHVEKPVYCGDYSTAYFIYFLGVSMRNYTIRPVAVRTNGFGRGGGFGGGRGGSFGGGGGGGGSRGR